MDMELGDADMMATARLVVQMTPKEKKDLESRARRAGVSTAEFVRRRVSSDDVDDHREEIEAVLGVLEAAAPAILRSVEETIATASALAATLDKARSEAQS